MTQFYIIASDMDGREIRRRLYKEDPYAGFDPAGLLLDLSGWGSTEPNFHALIDEVSPRLIIEVGTWKGASAIFMGSRLKASRLDCSILCVDTWLGALEFWTDQADETRYGALRLRNGYPSVYRQFLANVVRSGLQDLIIPFPQTSAIAARWLRLNGVRAELIYVDGSHDQEDVASDLRGYWGLLEERGILFGDDYDWPGVKAAVDRFAADHGLRVSLAGIQWVIRK